MHNYFPIIACIDRWISMFVQWQHPCVDNQLEPPFKNHVPWMIVHDIPCNTFMYRWLLRIFHLNFHVQMIFQLYNTLHVKMFAHDFPIKKTMHLQHMIRIFNSKPQSNYKLSAVVFEVKHPFIGDFRLFSICNFHVSSVSIGVQDVKVQGSSQ
jgi:hypothetical protein